MRRNRHSQSVTFPAPVKGLNDMDSIANMGAEYALVMDNWFPGTQDIMVRGGCTEYATGLPSTGETLMPYVGPVTTKLFCAAGTSIYDVTAGGAVGAAIATGMGNARFDSTNFGGASNNYLVAVNGSNLPQFYNGTTWTASGTGYATAITGVTASLFNQVNVWKNRLFFVEKGSLRCWFLGSLSIGGAASALDFSGVAKRGGHLVATATISSSAGITLDDYFVAITSEGECLVYQGTDPTNAATFALVGNYRIGRPVANGSDSSGGRFLSRLGSDTIAITANGIENLQDAINSDVIAQRKTISNYILNTLGDEVTNYAGNFGWQAMLAPIQNKLFINVPTLSDQSSRQYVMNTITGAWCRFTGWNATHFCYFGDAIYSIIGTKVYVMDTSSGNDFVSAGNAGSPINALLKTSFQGMGNKNAIKSFKMVRPLFLASGQITPAININTDFNDQPITSSSNLNASTNSKWGPGFAKWGPGFAKWGGSATYSQNWLSVNGLGYTAALKLAITNNGQTTRFQAWSVLYDVGAGL